MRRAALPPSRTSVSPIRLHDIPFASLGQRIPSPTAAITPIATAYGITCGRSPGMVDQSVRRISTWLLDQLIDVGSCHVALPALATHAVKPNSNAQLATNAPPTQVVLSRYPASPASNAPPMP